jgi:Cu2+-exporting ATPase
LFFARDGKALGFIAVADVIKADSRRAVDDLRDMSVRTVMLTGDNERTAQAVGREAGVDEVVAGVLPDGKENVVRDLQAKGKTAMVGDGINDAPALTRADVGVAIGAGADVAVDAADVVLMKSRLTDAVAAIRLSRATLKNIKENLFWAFIYNLVGIPLAAGVFIPVFGWKLTPMFGAAAMSLSSFCVVTNALRLNFFKLYGEEKIDIIGETKKKEVRTMEKKMKIEGMTCGHCEAHVKKALEALPEVAEAKVSHETGTAIVTLNADVANEALKQAVEAQDYTVLAVE